MATVVESQLPPTMPMSVLESQPPPTMPISVTAPGKIWSVEPVELLVQRGVRAVPEKYRRVLSEPACISRNPTEPRIPVIDLSGWDRACLEEVVGKVKFACEEWGFFRVVNHGVSPALMERMMNVAKGFMALPVEEKAAYVGQPGLISQGYGSRYIIKEDDVRDWRDFLFLHLQPPSKRDYRYWPSTPSSFRETMDEYSAALKDLALKLLAVISIALGLHPSFIEKALVEPHQKTLLNFYPACPEPELTAGFHKHSDFGALTVLMQEDGVAGLEVRNQGDWVPAEPIEGSFVVNVADQVEILTNGRYKSIEHRAVVNPNKSRLSVAVFMDAAPSAMIAPAQELMTGETPLYKQINFDDYETAFYDYGARGKEGLIYSSLARPN